MIAEPPKEVRNEFQNKHEQLKPLLEKMPWSTISIGQNWLNELESVSFEHYGKYAVSPELTDFMKNGLSLPVKHPEEAGLISLAVRLSMNCGREWLSMSIITIKTMVKELLMWGAICFPLSKKCSRYLRICLKGKSVKSDSFLTWSITIL